MKNILLIFCLIVLPFAALAQRIKKAEKNFLTELNNILQHSKDNDHWGKQGTMSIDSSFAINSAGILSVTVRFKNEFDEVVRARMEAPIKNIESIAYDLFLILKFNNDDVTKFESKANSEVLIEINKTNYLHIGAPVSDGRKKQEKLETLLKRVLKCYSRAK